MHKNLLLNAPCNANPRVSPMFSIEVESDDETEDTTDSLNLAFCFCYQLGRELSLLSVLIEYDQHKKHYEAKEETTKKVKREKGEKK